MKKLFFLVISTSIMAFSNIYAMQVREFVDKEDLEKFILYCIDHRNLKCESKVTKNYKRDADKFISKEDAVSFTHNFSNIASAIDNKFLDFKGEWHCINHMEDPIKKIILILKNNAFILLNCQYHPNFNSYFWTYYCAQRIDIYSPTEGLRHEEFHGYGALPTDVTESELKNKIDALVTFLATKP